MEGRSFEIGAFFNAFPELLPYLLVTLAVGAVSVLGGSLFGGILTWARLSRNKVASDLAGLYVYVIRCTPSIVLLFIVFYGVPKVAEEVFSINMDEWSRAIFVVITFILLFGGYVSEVFRSAYLTVHHGQYEAAVTAGLPPWKAVLLIMLPQAVVVALPNFGNAVINLLKESALAYTIGLIDLLGKANLMISKNYGGFGIEIWLAAFVIYWILNTLLGKLFLILESRFKWREGGEAYDH